MRSISPFSSGFTLLLGLIAGLPALSIDLSAPTLAILPVALNTTVFVAGLTLSLFVLGFGIGQFVGGRASDRFGRRPLLMIALTIYILSGACCGIATTGGQLATARLAQGIGAGACSVQAFAMVQDLFVGESARRKQAYVSVVLTIMPMLAPALGAVMILLLGWRSIHLAMAVGGLIIGAIVITSVAESRHIRPGLGRDGTGVADTLALLADHGFRGVTVVNALSYAAIFAYIAGAPVVMISQLGYTNSAYAITFASTAAALACGAVVNARLTRRYDARALIWPALVLQATSNVGLVGATLTLQSLGPWVLFPLLLVSCFMRGIISPNLVHTAISGHRDHAGLAAALVGLAQLLTAAASSAVLARLLGEFGIVSVAAIMAALSVGAVTLWVTGDVARVVTERG